MRQKAIELFISVVCGIKIYLIANKRMEDVQCSMICYDYVRIIYRYKKWNNEYICILLIRDRVLTYHDFMYLSAVAKIRNG